MFAHDLAQATAHPVAHDRAAEPACRDESGTKTMNLFRREHAEDQQCAMMGAAFSPNALEFQRARQAPGFWKRKRLARRHINCRSCDDAAI